MRILNNLIVILLSSSQIIEGNHHIFHGGESLPLHNRFQRQKQSNSYISKPLNENTGWNWRDHETKLRDYSNDNTKLLDCPPEEMEEEPEFGSNDYYSKSKVNSLTNCKPQINYPSPVYYPNQRNQVTLHQAPTKGPPGFNQYQGTFNDRNQYQQSPNTMRTSAYFRPTAVPYIPPTTVTKTSYEYPIPYTPPQNGHTWHQYEHTTRNPYTQDKETSTYKTYSEPTYSPPYTHPKSSTYTPEYYPKERISTTTKSYITTKRYHTNYEEEHHTTTTQPTYEKYDTNTPDYTSTQITTSEKGNTNPNDAGNDDYYLLPEAGPQTASASVLNLDFILMIILSLILIY